MKILESNITLTKRVIAKYSELADAAEELSDLFGMEITAAGLSTFIKEKNLSVSKGMDLSIRRNKKLWWTRAKINRAKKILGDSITISEAVRRVSSEFKREITEDGLRSAFIRNGAKGSLETYLKSSFKSNVKPEDTAGTIIQIISQHNNLNAAYAEIKRVLNIGRSTTLKKVKKSFGKDAKLVNFLKKETVVVDTSDEVSALVSLVDKHRDLCDLMNMAPSKVEGLVNEAIAYGYRVKISDDRFSVNKELETPQDAPSTEVIIPKVAKSTVRLGIISDTHFGSKTCLREEIKNFVDTAYNDYGVRTMLHCGDIFAGIEVYHGQEAEVSHWGCDAQLSDAVENLPKKDGLEYYGILGNHDVSYVKRAGVDIGDRFARLRPDYHHLGELKERLIVNGIDIELIHLKSSAHARSYSLEKHIYQSISKINHPDVVLCGHRHTNGYFEIQGVHTLLIPCFEYASIHLKYCDFVPSIGGVIMDFILDDDDKLIRVSPTFFLYKAEKIVGTSITV
jgi:predicted phosphodiesterase